MEQELEVAKAIQETLVPSDAPVHKHTLTFAGFYEPAAQTGGDWWTWAELTGGKILVVIGDVTGHGIPSAMITAAAKAACDVARHVHNDDVTVTRLLEIMNQRDLRERAAPVRDDVLRVDHRHEGADDHVRERRP